MKRHIPNLITSLNLFSGCIAIVMAFQGLFEWVIFWVLLAAVFDFFDGMVARLLNANSPIGKELDSLADVVSFGVAPAIAIFSWINNLNILHLESFNYLTLLPYIAFIIPVFSALRLAKFNLDERQSSSFLGLPTPANGIFWISYTYGLSSIGEQYSIKVILPLTILLIIIMSLLLVSEIPMFSFKLKNLSIKGNEKPLILLLATIIFIAIWGLFGLAIAILFYIILSLFKKRNR